MSYKLFVVIHTINGTIVETYSATNEDLLINKLPKDIIHKPDCKNLLYYGTHKEYVDGNKHCFYFTDFKTV